MMPPTTVAIDVLGATVTEQELAELTTLLLDAVDSGATVSFLAGLTQSEALAWWRTLLDARQPRAIVLVAREHGRIIGTVQMQPAWAPNQRHRGDVTKLLVLRSARGRGIARALMQAIERRALDNGFTLLMLNTRKGGAAERVYQSQGWTRIGEVPGFALDPSGMPGDTVLYYKQW